MLSRSIGDLPSSPSRTSSNTGVVEPVHTSVTKTTISIIKCFIGAASFELPGAIKAGGLVGSLLGILVLALLSLYTLLMLARCGEMLATQRASTYPEIGYAAGGAAGWLVSWMGIVVMTLGVCGSYFIFVANMTSQLLLPFDPFFTRAHCTMLIFPLFVLLSWGPYRYLSHFSVLGIAALIFALAAVLGDASAHHTIQPIDAYPTFNGAEYSLFMGNAAFVYLIHSVVLPMRNKMARPRFCPKTLAIATCFVTILNLCFAVPVYLLYADDTKGNVIDNLSAGPLKVAVQIALCVDLFFTYALFLFPMCEALENDLTRLRLVEPPASSGHEALLSDDSHQAAVPQPQPWWIRASLRAVLVAITAAVAVFVPDFSAMSALSGGLGNNVVGFILPPLFLTLLKHKQGWWADNGVGPVLKWAEITCNALIVCGGFYLFYASIKQFSLSL